MTLRPSELILNPDSSVFHLALRPDQIGQLIFLVGDPGRVSMVSRHFDELDVEVAKREFVTHTGRIGNRRITVVSTGIGTDNIDIVLNELDILTNVDLDTRTYRQDHQSLTVIRLGTSGAFQPEIDPGSVVCTAKAIGLDPLLHFYASESVRDHALQADLLAFADRHFRLPVLPYAVAGDPDLLAHYRPIFPQTGITLTLPGFYGPQGRRLNLDLHDPRMWTHLPDFHHQDLKVTNLEMESSGIYGLARLMGHRALSINLILANRIQKTFHPEPKEAMARMIRQVLDALPH